MENNVLSTRKLTRNFNGIRAVNEVDLEIRKGEIFGFLGPNGAGKSTTIHMLCGLLKPTSGEIFYAGKSFHNSREIRRHIGLCSQENLIWPDMTTKEQLNYMGAFYKIPFKELKRNTSVLLNDMGLYEKRNSLASKLSGGMKRKLNICLALVNNPDIVILDEPEAGLDPQSRVMVRDYIAGLAKLKTVILTTHNMDEADRLAERVAIIDHGSLLVTDTPQNLKKTTGSGDILEILCNTTVENKELRLVPDDSEVKIFFLDNTIKIQTRNVVTIMPGVIEKLLLSKVQINDIKIKQTTLEDVFMSLTGRALRN